MENDEQTNPKPDKSLMEKLFKDPKTTIILLILTVVLGGTNIGSLAKSGTAPDLKIQYDKIQEKLDEIHTTQIVIKTDLAHIKEDVEDNKDEIKALRLHP